MYVMYNYRIAELRNEYTLSGNKGSLTSPGGVAVSSPGGKVIPGLRDHDDARFSYSYHQDNRSRSAPHTGRRQYFHNNTFADKVRDKDRTTE